MKWRLEQERQILFSFLYWASSKPVDWQLNGHTLVPMRWREPAGKGHVTIKKGGDLASEWAQSCVSEEGRLDAQTGPEAFWPRDQVAGSEPVRENETELIMTDPADLEPSASRVSASERDDSAWTQRSAQPAS